MIFSKEVGHEQKRHWQAIVLCGSGSLLNIAAALTDNQSALVAVGCSMIAIGIAMLRRNKNRS